MNKNYTFWIIGAIVVIIIGVVLFMQSPAPSPMSTTSVNDTTSTINTSGTPRSTTNSTNKPIVVTTGFASVSSTTAMVAGTVIPEGVPTTYWIEYGSTQALGLSINNTTVINGYKLVGITTSITNLKPGTPYYFRLGAKNAYGTVYGGPYSFITASK